MSIYSIDNDSDIIDVSDITDRVDALRDEVSDFEDEGATDEQREELEENKEELATLEKLLAEMKGYGGNHKWEGEWYPDLLINEHHFQDYAEEFATSCGMIPNDLAWPCTCIDWEEAAKDLKRNYSRVDFDGATYWHSN